jgi:flagellar biosynthesis GTPase FlhF
LFDLISQKSAGKISKNTKIAGDVMGAANLPMLMQQMMSMNSTSGASAGLVDYANGILGKQIVSAPGSIPPPPAYRDPVAEYPFYDFGKEEKASEEKPASVTVPSASLAASTDPVVPISIATPEVTRERELERARAKAAAEAKAREKEKLEMEEKLKASKVAEAEAEAKAADAEAEAKAADAEVKAKAAAEAKSEDDDLYKVSDGEEDDLEETGEMGDIKTAEKLATVPS